MNFAKQDSPVEYEKQKDELYKKKDSLLNDDYENYIWTDFINDSNQFFSSNDELKKFFTTNFPRVCAKINYGKGIYFKKETLTERHNIVNCRDIMISYSYVTGKNKKNKETII